VHGKAIRVLVEAVRKPMRVPLEALRLLQRCLLGTLSIHVGCVSVVEAMKVSVEAGKGSNKGRESAHRGCRVGGFNVSNLMGIKHRMIDIGKKITFYFLQNV
jgi:hypothetical protein